MKREEDQSSIQALLEGGRERKSAGPFVLVVLVHLGRFARSPISTLHSTGNFTNSVFFFPSRLLFFFFTFFSPSVQSHGEL